MHNILNTLWEWTEGSSKTDFGPVKAVGRRQTRPVEALGHPCSHSSKARNAYYIYFYMALNDEKSILLRLNML